MPDLVLSAVTLVWGSSFVVVRHVLETAPPLALLFFRFVLATILASVALLFRPGPKGAWRDGLVLGGILGLGMSLQVVGQAETTASKAGFLTGLAVVLTPFVAVFRTKKLPSLPNGLGILLASAGFFLLTFPASGGPVSRGDLFVAAGGVVFAFYGVELAERGGRRDAFWLTAIQVAVTMGMAGILSLLLRLPALAALPVATLEARPIPWHSDFPASTAYLAAVCTFLGFLGWTWSQGRMSAIHGAILLALEPVFAALFAAWFLSERLGPRGYAGATLILTGILVSELPWRRFLQSSGNESV
jgi:drug/metabolite transporter (DMT)-like permease